MYSPEHKGVGSGVHSCALEAAVLIGYILPICVLLLSVDGYDLSQLPLALSAERSVGIERQLLECPLLLNSFLVVPHADDERRVLRPQLLRLFVRLWVCPLWFVSAARGEGECSKHHEHDCINRSRSAICKRVCMVLT